MTIYMTSDLHVDHYINHRVSLENYINNALVLPKVNLDFFIKANKVV